MAITRSTFREISPQVVDVQVAGTIDDPAPATSKQVLADVSDELSTTCRRSTSSTATASSAASSSRSPCYIKLIQDLLVLSVITALFGIANTLSLSINERDPRARPAPSGGHGPVERALLGPLGGLPDRPPRRAVGVSLGIVLSVALTKAMESYGLSSFAFPGGWLGLIGLATVAAGHGGLDPPRPAGRGAVDPRRHRLRVAASVTIPSGVALLP